MNYNWNLVDFPHFIVGVVSVFLLIVLFLIEIIRDFKK